LVTLTGLIRTFIVLSQPFAGLPYENRKVVKFRNGWKFNLTYSQYRDFRDNYQALKKYVVKQVTDDMFSCDFGKFKITRSSPIICSAANLLERYQINQIEEDAFQVKGDKFELEGTSCVLLVLAEQLRDGYRGNFTNKVVLDIGGFQGETAMLFSLAGAKKVIIYEPIEENYQFIKRNVELNQINAEVHNTGIGSENGIKKMKNEPKNANFSFYPKGEFEIKIENVTEIISHSKADIAKFDCEGAEICLCTVPSEILKKIPVYMVELHGEDVQKQVTKKFLDSGFKVLKRKPKSQSLVTVYFVRRALLREPTHTKD